MATGQPVAIQREGPAQRPSVWGHGPVGQVEALPHVDLRVVAVPDGTGGTTQCPDQAGARGGLGSGPALDGCHCDHQKSAARPMALPACGPAAGKDIRQAAGLAPRPAPLVRAGSGVADGRVRLLVHGRGSRPQPAGGPTGSRSRMGPGPGRSAGAGGMSSLAGAATADAPDRRDPAGGDISQLADVCAPMSPHPRSTPTTGSSPGADGGDEPAASAAAARPLPGAGQTVPSCTGAPSLPRAAVGDLAGRAEGAQARGAGAGHSTSP